jgi:hypothetical protein
MNPTLFHTLWQAHPGTGTPCNVDLFRNQCAIRLGVSLDASHIKVTGVRRCATVYPTLRSHSPGHILSAQELADALAKNPKYFGSKVAVKKLNGSMQSNMGYLQGKKGVLFIQNGWGPTDHIDLWDGMTLKGGDPEYYLKGEQIWFWHIA